MTEDEFEDDALEVRFREIKREEREILVKFIEAHVQPTEHALGLLNELERAISRYCARIDVMLRPTFISAVLTMMTVEIQKYVDRSMAELMLGPEE